MIKPSYIYTKFDEETYDIDESTEIPEMELGKWYTISAPSKISELDQHLLFLPIVPDKEIIVDLDYHGELEFSDILEGDFLNITFPIVNPIFNEINETSGMPNYRFSTKYSRIDKLPSMTGMLVNTPDNILRKYDYSLPSSTSVKLSKISIKLMGETLEDTLKNIYDFVSHASSGECHDEDDFHYNDLEYLLDEYLSTGKFSGDCKAISTFTLGLLQAMGLVSRRVTGRFLYIPSAEEMRKILEEKLNKLYSRLEFLKENEGFEFMRDRIIKRIEGIEQEIREFEYGHSETCHKKLLVHTWAEVYIPTEDGKGNWILIDPATGIFKNYPNKNIEYHLLAELPRFTNPSVDKLKIRINYI